MNSSELSSSLSLSGIFALRMLGLFLILPIFSLYAHGLPNGDNAVLVGLTIGMYGMVQAFFHIPLGILSDKLGRRMVVIGGLSLFVIGALVAASHDDLYWILAGRAIQGAGAISAAITAWVADLTREEVRTRAMALIGGSIAISFAISIVIAAPLYNFIGMRGIFLMMALFGVIAIFVAWKVVPHAPLSFVPQPQGTTSHTSRFLKVLKDPQLFRLNIGVLILHASQVALFLVVPKMLVANSLPLDSHWKVYLAVLVGSILVMAPMLIKAEKMNRLALLVKIAIIFMLVADTYFGVIIFGNFENIWTVSFGLLLYFVGFNLLESLQPSLVSRISGDNRGAGLGVYNTTMSLGLFLGGIVGGLVDAHFGPLAVFEMGAVLLLVWLIIATRMSEFPPKLKVQ
jgi:predicted MFS family arabinose efflux permease